VYVKKYYRRCSHATITGVRAHHHEALSPRSGTISVATSAKASVSADSANI
jgi:hypothetical protein